MAIKAVVFDLGKVLCTFSHEAICEQLTQYSPLSAPAIYQAIFQSGLEEKFDTGQISPENFYQQAVQLINAQVALPDFQQAWVDIFALDKEVARIFYELADYPRYLLSNTNIWHFRHLQNKFTLLRQFDGYALSFELGVKKPAPEIYQHILRLSGLAAAECVYIDDIAAYVQAAKNLGFAGIHFQGAAHLCSELFKLGLPVGDGRL